MNYLLPGALALQHGLQFEGGYREVKERDRGGEQDVHPTSPHGGKAYSDEQNFVVPGDSSAV